MISRILTEFFEAINRREVIGLKQLYSENAVIHSLEGPLRGPDGIKVILDRWWLAFPDIQIVPLASSQEEDVIVVHWRAVGTQKQPMLNLPATNKTTAFHGLTCFRIEDSQVVEHWACTDYRSLSR